MAFFTDNVEIAESYSKNKVDTSLSREYITEKDLFKIDGKSLDEYWNSLSKQEQQRITQKASNVGFDDNYENIIYDTTNNSFGRQFEYYLKNESNNNALDALYKIFIEDGNLFGEEMEKFTTALELAGVENVEYLDIYKKSPRVYEVYLNV